MICVEILISLLFWMKICVMICVGWWNFNFSIELIEFDNEDEKFDDEHERERDEDVWCLKLWEICCWCCTFMKIL